MGLLTEFLQGLSSGYAELSGTFSPTYFDLVNVFIFAILIALYAVFTWKFYRYLSKKDLIDLNLQQYNRTTRPGTNKFFAAILYLVEYIIVLPFLISFWFAVLALIILVLSEELVIAQIVVVSAAMIAAVRMLSYYEEDLSRDLAKMFPFTVLAIFILSPGFFSFERIITNLQGVPLLLKNIALFLLLIVGVELILRVIDLITNMFKSTSDTHEMVENQKDK